MAISSVTLQQAISPRLKARLRMTAERPPATQVGGRVAYQSIQEADVQRRLCPTDSRP